MGTERGRVLRGMTPRVKAGTRPAVPRYLLQGVVRRLPRWKEAAPAGPAGFLPAGTLGAR